MTNPKPPVHPAKYHPSKQVGLLVEMINENGSIGRHSPWVTDEERRFNDGVRHGLNITLRALVELETRITDPDLIDDICADLITESLINKC